MDANSPIPQPSSNSLPGSTLQQSVLRLSVVGSVDDGKSTLIGRLLWECNAIPTDQKEQLILDSQKNGFPSGIDYSWVVDGLEAEREQGITIDVAHRYFSTDKRKFILSDCPGHIQYTRNMVTGTSQADLALLVVDANKPLSLQCKRHAFLAHLLGVPRLLIAINKMDSAGYQEEKFETMKAHVNTFVSRLSIQHVKFIPTSALHGDNVKSRGKNLSWYSGPSLLEFLEDVYIAGDTNKIDFRFPVQTVLKDSKGARWYAGRLSSGKIRTGEEVCVLPGQQLALVAEMRLGEQVLHEAEPHQSVAIRLDQDIDIGRGHCLARPNNRPMLSTELEATLVWLSDQSLSQSDLKQKRLKILIHAQTSSAEITEVHYKFDLHELHRDTDSQDLGPNDIFRARLITHDPISFDTYDQNRQTGHFVLVDQDRNETLAAGMILKSISPTHNQDNVESKFGSDRLAPLTLWLTGLSGAGKTTLAQMLLQKLKNRGIKVIHLDGDQLRDGLCRDLGFSNSDRSENIRRTAELANLLNKQGVMVIASLISPLTEQRELAKNIVNKSLFREIHVDATVEECALRDPKGLYKKARDGSISNLTGVQSPYEQPSEPDLYLNTVTESKGQCVEKLCQMIREEKS